MAEADTQEGFQFYLKFAKPLVLNCASPRDRVLASAWVVKLKQENSGSEKLRTDYLKLLLFVLQKGKLFGPFVNNPGQYDELEDFPLNVRLRDVAKSWIESEENRGIGRLYQGLGGRGGAGDNPPLTTECSADLLEYAAAQDIPNFGIHAYYAISNEPINNWQNLEKGIFPKGALAAVRKVESAGASLTSTARRRSRSRSRSRSRTQDDMDLSGRDTQVSFKDDYLDQPFPGMGSGRRPPMSPLGSLPPPERITATWGSNLISVGDPPIPEGMPFALTAAAAAGISPEPEPGAASMATAVGRTPMPTIPTFEGTPTGPILQSTPIPPPGTPTQPMTPIEQTSAFSLPYLTPPWDMSAPSLPYQTPEYDRNAPGLPYQTTSYDVPPESPPFEYSMSPFRRTTPEKLDFSNIGEAPVRPRIPGHLQFEMSPISPVAYSSPEAFPEGEAANLFDMEEPSFLVDESLEESIPYQSPPYDPIEMAERQYESILSPESLRRRRKSTPPAPICPGTPARSPVQEAARGRPSPAAPLYSPERRTPPRPARSPVQEAARARPSPAAPLYSPERRTPPRPARSPVQAAARARPRPAAPSRIPERSSRIPKRAKSPVQEVQDILEQGIRSSPEATDIVEDALREMSIVQEQGPTLEELYAQQDIAYPHRIQGMARTPPVFSKDPRIRRAGRQIQYPETQFDIPEPVDWRQAEDVIPGERMPTSPPEDLRARRRPVPFGELFPGMEMPPEYAGIDDQAGDITLVEDSALLVTPPRKRRDLSRRLMDVLGEIDRVGQEVPHTAGIPATTPKRSPSPVRPTEEEEEWMEREDDDLFFYTVKPPEDFGMDPEDYMSPTSKAEAQYQALLTPPRSPEEPRIETPEFLREERRTLGIPDIVIEPWEPPHYELAPDTPEKEVEEPRPRKKEKKKRKVKKRGSASSIGKGRSRLKKPAATASTSSVEVRAEEDDRAVGVAHAATDEIAQIYKTMVQEDDSFEAPTPPPRQFTPPQRWSPDVQPLALTPAVVPERYDPYADARTPREYTREEMPEALEYIEEPVFEEPWDDDDVPPSPPAPFEYDSPEAQQYMSLDQSPPLRELIGAHEFTEEFFDPRRPRMRRTMSVGGRRVSVQKPASRQPAVSPIDEFEEELYYSPKDAGEEARFERAIYEAQQITAPQPTAPRSPGQPGPSGLCKGSKGGPDQQPVCKKGATTKEGGKAFKSKLRPPSKSKLRPPTKISKTALKTPKSSKTALQDAKTPKMPKQGPRADTPGPGAPPTPKAPSPKTPLVQDRAAYRPLTRREHRYVESFDDPQHRELMARVAHIIADTSIASPPSESPPERDFEDIEGLDYIVETPPREYAPNESDLPELTPPMEVPEFGFQSDLADFMPQAAYNIQLQRPLTPVRQRTTPPRYVERVDFSPLSFEPGPMLADISPEMMRTPPLEDEEGEAQVRQPSPSPSPDDIDWKLFYSDVNMAASPTYYYTGVSRRGRPMRRVSRSPRMDEVYELPESPGSEEHRPFYEALTAHPRVTKRRNVRAGSRRVKGSRAPRLSAVSEHIDYPDSPTTTRSPAPARTYTPTPPRSPSPPAAIQGPLVSIPYESPQQTIERGPGGRRRPSNIQRKMAGRRLDFDETPPSPPSPKRAPCAPCSDEEFDYGPRTPPPDDLMGTAYPVQTPPQSTMIDYEIPGGLPSPLAPRVKFPWYDTPPHLKIRKPPQPVFKFQPELPMRGALAEMSPIQFPESPELLPEEIEEEIEEDDFALATGLPEFPPSPPRTPPSPFELGPSPVKRFERQLTPEAVALRRYGPMGARLVTPPRIRRPPAPGLVNAQREFRDIMLSSREGGGRPPEPLVVKTSKTVVTPEKTTTVTTIKRSSPGREGGTPPMIIPEPYQDIFSRVDLPAPDLFGMEAPEFMELSPESEMRRAVQAAPRRTVRQRPTELYGYGEVPRKTLARKQRPPSLGTVSELAEEPPDEYEYWPGPHRRPAPPLPSPICPGGRLAPPIRPTAPPSSARKPRGSPGIDYHAIGMIEPRRTPAVEDSLSPAQRPRRPPPRAALTRKRLDFDEPEEEETYIERIGKLVSDIPDVEGFEAPQLAPAEYIEFNPPQWSPVGISALDVSGYAGLDVMEEPEGMQSPRTPSPRRSPGLPTVDEYGGGLERFSPPPDDLYRSPESPEYMSEEYIPPEYVSPEYDYSPPRSPRKPSPGSVCPGSASIESPESFRRRLESEYHEATQPSPRRRTPSPQISPERRRSKTPSSRTPPERRRSRTPSPRTPERRPRTPPRVETMIEFTPPQTEMDQIQAIMDDAEQQYLRLLDTPERERRMAPAFEPIGGNVMDLPLVAGSAAQLPLPLPDQMAFEPDMAPAPTPRIPPRYTYQASPMNLEEQFRAIAAVPPQYMLGYGGSPPLISTPPRDIFAEAMEMDEQEEEDIEALLVGSPARRTPPGGGSPCDGSPVCGGSPISPGFTTRVREHESFYDRRFERPRRYARRQPPATSFEGITEIDEEPIIPSGGLMPSVYPTGAPPSAERHYRSPVLPSPMRIEFEDAYREPISPPIRSPVATHPRTPGRRLTFDDAPESPEKVTQSETVSYQDPTTGMPVTETTIEETIYGQPRTPSRISPRTPSRPSPRSPTGPSPRSSTSATPRRTPIRSPQTPRRSPCGAGGRPCASQLSPVDFGEIDEAFGGRISPDILDTSDIPAEMEAEPFSWLG